MAWAILIVAGLFEVVWASALPETRAFSRLVPSVVFLASLGVSMYLLAVATRSIPIGVGYAVWVGIGAAGTFAVGLLRGETTNPAQLVAMAVLLIGIVGVRLTSEA